MEKKKARDKAIKQKIKRWAEAKADWFLAGMLGMKQKRCPFCGKISSNIMKSCEINIDLHFDQ
jgi:hypothetical protein